jgi:LmbE family N-acetylglucosaminyl deacetylase
MKYLFVFAHPDDETVACAGTIKKLRDNGDEVYLVAVTLGDAGEVMESAQAALKKHGSVEKLRQSELEAASKHLNLSKLISLGFKDGEITNKSVWGSLQHAIIDQINLLKPDVVVTFDHTGWYYHLDHVGVSIATTLAFHESEHRPQLLLHSHFQPGGLKWKYVFHASPATHQVRVTDIEHKLKSLDQHLSQNLDTPRNFITKTAEHFELYEVAFATSAGMDLLNTSGIFSPTKE